MGAFFWTRTRPPHLRPHQADDDGQVCTDEHRLDFQKLSVLFCHSGLDPESSSVLAVGFLDAGRRSRFSGDQVRHDDQNLKVFQLRHTLFRVFNKQGLYRL